MAYVVKMPKLGLEMKSGELSAWLVSEGDEVTEGDPIAEIESEKTTAEIDAKEDGVLRRVVLAEGESTAPGGALAIVAGADEDISGLEADAGVGEGGSEPVATDDSAGDSSPTEVTETTETAATGGGDASSVAQSRSRGSDGASENGEVRASPRAKRLADDLGVDLTTVEGTGPQGAITESDVETAAESATATAAEKRVFAPPSARRLARELGVDIEAVEGTGQNGRITESDVRAAGGATAAATDSSAAGAATTAATDATAASEPAETERPLSGMRRTIADRLGESYREAVHVTVDRRADAEELLAAANAAADALGVDVSITDVLLLALSASLDEHPEFNATFEDGVHRLHGEHNVCIAVDVDEGLIAPVVRDVASLSLSELAETRAETTQRALSGDFTMDDLSGGTFTVSNLGVLGVESFDPIINPPQVAILGVNTIRREAVPTDDGDVAVRRVISFSLSFDHRIVDGADAARMLGTLVEHVENPWPLVIAAGGR
ncbi:2-oxo acid dehydrogenase subunit E2 [Haloferax volcanii]|uniref:Dihydrolipoamide S-acyltransferase n=3 Tax=Haloferax volcanii TaxID=2246 RepID=D4GSS6_HALVD|nr:2-oxo acid dehydrogenase subunit E2 [Haloferax volcanii]ADE04485.1 dihydrolipoamide S-acyltransferase [Haloferax volcanii DS2]ELY26469.1 dihydrolipoamide S-acyltransferase [Haloferax volcanii DS2]MBS8119781.1 2-oxo acid dehydrogenase subunit E2 [Haloferax volcanii]MBS8124793.1 2-oxo acid dehydrogenase subunit E2 [Haloferax volcanii]MBS8128856.1 2-oxo acid dehydrogenase subunit E2 [Haloferax volcanii]